MAQNRKAKAAPRTASKDIKEKKQTPPLVHSDSIVEAIDVAENASMHETPQPKQCEQRALKKCLVDNFAGWPDILTHMTFVDGLNLVDTLARDRERMKRDSDFKMGKFYYQHMRETFGGTSPEALIAVEDENEPDDMSLQKVLRQAFAHNRKLEPLAEYVKSVSDLSQKNAAALLRASMRLSPTSSMESTSILVDVLRCLVRLDIVNKHPATFGPAKAHFDSALCKSLATAKKNKVTGKDWWERYRNVASAFVPQDSVDRIYKCTNSFNDIKGDLKIVVASSRLGDALVGKAYEQTKHYDVEALIQDSVKTLLKGEVSATLVENAKQEFLESVRGMGKDPFAVLNPAKEVQVDYRGFTFTIPCSCVVAMWSVAKDAALRAAAVDCGSLPPLWCENDLVCSHRTIGTAKIPKEVVQESASSRAACKGLIDPARASGDSIRSVLKSKKAFLLQLDPGFRVELGFFMSFVGATAEARMKAKIMDQLPTEGEKLTIDVVRQRVMVLSGSALVKFMGTGLGAMVTTVQGFLSSLHSGRCPKFPGGAETDFMKAVKEALARLCVFKDKENFVFGKDALELLWAKVEAKTKRTVTDLRPLNQFSWLLTDSRKVELRMWDDGVMDPKEVALACAQNASGVGHSAASSLPAKAAKRKRGPVEVTDLVSKMFKKA